VLLPHFLGRPLVHRGALNEASVVERLFQQASAIVIRSAVAGHNSIPQVDTGGKSCNARRCSAFNAGIMIDGSRSFPKIDFHLRASAASNAARFPWTHSER
jgi:hypothetical protein